MKKIILFLLSWLLIVFSTLEGNADTNFKVVNGIIKFPEPKRIKGQEDVLALRCDPIPVVRVAFIGIGMRGSKAVERYCQLEGVEIKALCDVNSLNVQDAKATLKKFNKPAADTYTGVEDWKKICKRPDIDLIYICTPWELHSPIAVYAMNHGKHAAVEVPAALTIQECWALVDASERNRKHCIMLENCIYDYFEMATLNMSQKGVLGDLLYAEGAYIHDLRSLMFDEENGYWNMWRLKYNQKHTGNPYPTHGLGPIAHSLNIHRGDRMDYLVSMSTSQKGLTLHARQKYGDESPFVKQSYALGDMNNTLIHTIKGKNLLIQHDISNPRPYNRLYTLVGTKGYIQKYPFPIATIEPNSESVLTNGSVDSLLKVYEHPFYKEIGEKAREVGGHGGMDYVMDYRLIYCLHNGLPLDMDVYDAAEWSSIVELSEVSVLNGSAPVKVPDFTRGEWNKLEKLNYAW